jgi:hypothetical protein
MGTRSPPVAWYFRFVTRLAGVFSAPWPVGGDIRYTDENNLLENH